MAEFRNNTRRCNDILKEYASFVQVIANNLLQFSVQKNESKVSTRHVVGPSDLHRQRHYLQSP
ncbi:hypothetical protein [Saccharibacter floricola]|uniref:hypothetical protein n=1 Tax=Saccharibacter floricola TaxID=231053 RepID=UPI00035D2E4D|nr:hypothetical protein [Saccharibacter floricola]